MKKVLFFSASWCSSCSKAKQDVFSLCKEHGFEFCTVDVDTDEDLVADYMIDKLPTLVFLKNEIAYRCVDNVLEFEAGFRDSS